MNKGDQFRRHAVRIRCNRVNQNSLTAPWSCDVTGLARSTETISIARTPFTGSSTGQPQRTRDERKSFLAFLFFQERHRHFNTKRAANFRKRARFTVTRMYSVPAGNAPSSRGYHQARHADWPRSKNVLTIAARQVPIARQSGAILPPLTGLAARIAAGVFERQHAFELAGK